MLYKILRTIYSIISSFFLTYIVEREGFAINLQCVFVFLYFITIHVVCGIFIRKSEAHKVVNKYRIVAMGGIVSVVILTFTVSSFYPQKYINTPLTIVALNQKNDISNGKEVWISEVKVDDKSIDLEDVGNLLGWQYKSEENVLYANGESNIDNYLELYLPEGRVVQVVFVKHPWSGMISIKEANEEKVYDLYAGGSSQLQYTYTREQLPLKPIQKLAVITGYFFVLFEVFFGAGRLIYTRMLKRKKK